MRTAPKVLSWLAGVIIGLPIALIALVMVLANTDWGRHAIEQASSSLSGGRVSLAGLSGHFPDDLRLAHIEVSDAQGTWLTLDDVALRWSPTNLLSRQLHVEQVRVAHIGVLRLPAPSESKSKGMSSLPVRVDADHLDVDRLDLGAAVAGTPAALAIHGDVHMAASLDDGETAISITRIDGVGTYTMVARIDASSIKADITADEPARGVLQQLAKLPELGPVLLRVHVDGPRNDQGLTLALSAGPLQASARGRMDWVARAMNVDVTASAPAMAPREDLRWRSIALQGHVEGSFTQPSASGQIRVEQLSATGTEVRRVRADVKAQEGGLRINGSIDGLRIPGPQPDVFAAAPIDIDADVRLDDAARPITFKLAHPMLSLQGRGNIGGEPRVAMTVTAPALAPLAALAGIDVNGQARFDATLSTQGGAKLVELDGGLDVTGGTSPVAKLLGGVSKLGFAAKLDGQDITITRAQLDGANLHASANGSRKDNSLDVRWKLALTDLGKLTSSVGGPVEGQGRVQGTMNSLEVVADGTGDLRTDGFPHGPVTLSARVRGLPSAPVGNVEAHGSIAGAPVQLAIAFDRTSDGIVRTTVQRADWKSAHAEGKLDLRPGERLPEGQVSLRVGRLADLQALTGALIEGDIAAKIDLAKSVGRSQANIQLVGHDIDVEGNRVQQITLAGTVADPTAQPSVALHLSASGIAAYGLTGNARLEANGPQQALKLTLSSDLVAADSSAVHVNTAATLDVPGKQVVVNAMRTEYKGETLRLLAPAQASFRDGVAIDHLRLGIQEAVIELAGRISPALDVTASVRNATPALAKAFLPDLQADGKLSLDARLTGTTSQPRGTIRMTAQGLRSRSGAARALPAGNVVASADLNGDSARVDVSVSAGNQNQLNVTGRVPLSAAGALDLHVKGGMDPAMANPILQVDGRSVKGHVTLDVAVKGTFRTPTASGSVRLNDGEFQDYALGARITDVDARLDFAEDTVRITSLSAKAGPGTLSASGSIGLFAEGRPIDLKITGRNAQPLASDLLTANVDLDLTVRGGLQTRIDVAGSTRINHADINIPNALPSSVAVLDVRRPGQKPAAATPAPSGTIGLNLTVDAPRAVFVRGRGLDAEVAGQLRVTGTAASPQISGGFDMRRGTFDLAGALLKFTTGKVSFNGTGVRHRLDPTLDFDAESTTSNITAKLKVTGYADAPQIELSSTPELPQDQVLARLLFGVDVKQLTALQIAQIGSALATIGGVGGGGLNPLMAVQKKLGLDRLAVGGTSTGGASVEAGRYVSDRVYVGAKQSTSGGTQAQVQVDLTKHLKLQATLGSGGAVQGATPDNDPGSSIGLSYQYEY